MTPRIEDQSVRSEFAKLKSKVKQSLELSALVILVVIGLVGCGGGSATLDPSTSEGAEDAVNDFLDSTYTVADCVRINKQDTAYRWRCTNDASAGGDTACWRLDVKADDGNRVVSVDCPEEIRAKKAEQRAEKAAQRKEDQGSRKRIAAGWYEASEGIWWKWGDNNACTGSYQTCWTMKVASTRCRALSATIERKASRGGPSVGETSASVGQLDARGEGLLQFKAANGQWAELKTLECGAGSGDGSTYGGATATDGVQFSVTGSASSGVDITYGNDTSNLQGPGRLPAYMSMPERSDALYYAMSAQLQGGGSITCKLSIGGAVAVGHASGGYNICSVQLNSDYNGGWSK